MKSSEEYMIFKEEAEKVKQSLKNLEILSPKKEASIRYAYHCDNYIETILSLTPVKKELKKLLNNYYESKNIRISNLGCKVTLKSFPKLYSILKDCSKTLEIKDIPDVFVSNKLKSINALAMEINDVSAILISPMSIFSLSEDELRFMLGHELGHLVQGNLLCHTANGILSNVKRKYEVIGTIMTDLIELPLKEWCRVSEYTADRAGYLCCKNMNAVVSLFNKVGKEKSKSGYYNYTEIYKDHPYIQNRIDRIREYTESI